MKINIISQFWWQQKRENGQRVRKISKNTTPFCRLAEDGATLKLLARRRCRGGVAVDPAVTVPESAPEPPAKLIEWNRWWLFPWIPELLLIAPPLLLLPIIITAIGPEPWPNILKSTPDSRFVLEVEEEEEVVEIVIAVSDCTEGFTPVLPAAAFVPAPCPPEPPVLDFAKGWPPVARLLFVVYCKMPARACPWYRYTWGNFIVDQIIVHSNIRSK